MTEKLFHNKRLAFYVDMDMTIKYIPKGLVKNLINIRVMTQEEREKREQETLRKMRVYNLHASKVDILEEAGEL